MHTKALARVSCARAFVCMRNLARNGAENLPTFEKNQAIPSFDGLNTQD